MGECAHLAGDPDCPIRECRTRWLVGSTTGEPFTPGPIPSLILDILETWAGDWFTPDQIISHSTRIRPGIDPWSVRIAILRVQTNGGGWFGNGRQPGSAFWMKVETRPDSRFSTSTDFGFMLRVPQRG